MAPGRSSYAHSNSLDAHVRIAGSRDERTAAMMAFWIRGWVIYYSDGEAQISKPYGGTWVLGLELHDRWPRNAPVAALGRSLCHQSSQPRLAPPSCSRSTRTRRRRGQLSLTNAQVRLRGGRETGDTPT